MITRKIILLFLFLSFFIIVVLCPVTGLDTGSHNPTAYTGKLSDGLTDYNLLVPANWNGTLLASLDTIGCR